MRPLSPPFPSWLVLSLLATTGCQKFGKGSGDYGLFFDGPPSCGTVTLGSSAFPDTLTVEAWVKADSALSYAIHPVVVWPGAFALWETTDGITSFTDASATEAGATQPTPITDGDVHHVAGTWDGSKSTLFVDGVRVAFNTVAVMGQTPGEVMYVGCWGGKDHHFEGIIDEVRVSDVVRYTDDFTLPDGAFEGDDDTRNLWHCDEGEGNVCLDDMGRADITLEAVEWKEFTSGAGG